MLCPRLRVAYFPAPKVANTSLKHFFYEAEHGKRFETKIDETTGEKLHIHKVFGTPYWSDEFIDLTRDYIRICVVRDPMERVVSAYRNRVVHYGELNPKKADEKLMRKRGLKPDPTLDEFIRNLEGYRSVKKSIQKHTEPLAAFLGPNPRSYHLVLRMCDIDRLRALTYGLAGIRPQLRRMQQDGPALTKDMLTPDQQQIIRKFYAYDYTVFAEFFR